MNVEDFDKAAEIPDIPVVPATAKFPPGIGSYGGILILMEEKFGMNNLPTFFEYSQITEDKDGNRRCERWRFDTHEVLYEAGLGH